MLIKSRRNGKRLAGFKFKQVIRKTNTVYQWKTYSIIKSC
ncbi:MAG: hypothetical protein FD170_2558 [Bacteroidetes bacterium]|nr:MAG: hypothetical protein FD170_2558 [Bacteroidota bacterium]